MALHVCCNSVSKVTCFQAQTFFSVHKIVFITFLTISLGHTTWTGAGSCFGDLGRIRCPKIRENGYAWSTIWNPDWNQIPSWREAKKQLQSFQSKWSFNVSGESLGTATCCRQENEKLVTKSNPKWDLELLLDPEWGWWKAFPESNLETLLTWIPWRGIATEMPISRFDLVKIFLFI